MADERVYEDSDFVCVFADMKELVPCRMCGRFTRTEWQRKKNPLRLFICADHKPDEVWNFMIDYEAGKIGKN
jgi:hypothetical protein